MKAPILAPSVLAANYSRLAEGIAEIAPSGAEWTHLDVMDGNFVPPISFGAKMVADLRPLSSTVFDVHLMVQNPEAQIQTFAQAGADNISFHYEAAVHVHRIIMAIKDLGKKAGLSIVPSSPVEAIVELLPLLDLVLIMTVNPGYGGQTLIPRCLDKVRRLAEIREKEGYSYLISVDGGVNRDTAPLVREAGADVLIAGEAFFGSPDKKAAAAHLKGLAV
ncbi:MAG: ribulose-phosphate 3-epimerase [Treponema sp.]|nr:ribulose-phosphate 3-epimerase [Treponema sp.]